MRRHQGSARNDFGLVTLEHQHIIGLLVLDVIPLLMRAIADRISFARASGKDVVGGLEIRFRVKAPVIGNGKWVILNWSADGSPDVENLSTFLTEPLGIVTEVQEDAGSASLRSLIDVSARHWPVCVGCTAELILLSGRRGVSDGVIEDESAARSKGLLEESVDFGIILALDLLFIEEVLALQFTLMLDPLKAAVVRDEAG